MMPKYSMTLKDYALLGISVQKILKEADKIREVLFKKMPKSTKSMKNFHRMVKWIKETRSELENEIHRRSDHSKDIGDDSLELVAVGRALYPHRHPYGRNAKDIEEIDNYLAKIELEKLTKSELRELSAIDIVNDFSKLDPKKRETILKLLFGDKK